MSIPRPPRPLSLLLALVLGAACALLVACGAKNNPHLFSPARADRLKSELDDVRNAVDSGDCQAAKTAVRRLQDEVASLPSDIDPRLRQRLQEGASNLAQRAPQDCRQNTQTTPTVTETVPTVTETTTTPTQTTTATTTTPTQTQTTTTPTQTQTTPTQTTTTPDSGGSTAPTP